jgi:hypothetical protein
MEDILLQAIVDKLEALDKTTEKLSKMVDGVTNYSPSFKEVNEKIRMVHMEVRGIPEQISFPEKEIYSQRMATDSLLAQLKQPLNPKVKHIHYLDTPMLLCIAMTIIILGLSFWINILYDDIHWIEKFPHDHSVTLPSNIPENQAISKHQKLKSKSFLVYRNSRDSLTRSKKMMEDSIYKLLMSNYEQKRPEMQTNPAGQRPNQVKKSEDSDRP